jgi:hypothetical protein
MDWFTTLRRSGGINALSRQLGAAPAEVALGAEVLLVPLLGGLRQRSERLGGGQAGVRALVDELTDLGGGQLAADVMGPGPLNTAAGDTILERVLGPEVARRAVLIEAERNGGLDQGLGERILPGLAMLVGGYITARAIGSGTEGSGGLANRSELFDSLTANDHDADPDRI